MSLDRGLSPCGSWEPCVVSSDFHLGQHLQLFGEPPLQVLKGVARRRFLDVVLTAQTLLVGLDQPALMDRAIELPQRLYPSEEGLEAWERLIRDPGLQVGVPHSVGEIRLVREP